MDAREIMEKLQAPFRPEDIEWRVGSTNAQKTQGLALAYITNRAIQNRLDEVFTPFGWQNEFREWKDKSQICGISVKFGDEWITKWDGADDSNTEAVKGGLSDAMKRAGYQWGIGRYLYDLPAIWMPIKEQGRSYVLTAEPKLPAWALPQEPGKGKGQQQSPSQPKETPALQSKPQETAKPIYTAKMLVDAIRELAWSDTDARLFIQQNTGKKGTKDLTQDDLVKLFALLDEQKKALEEAMSAERGAASA